MPASMRPPIRACLLVIGYLRFRSQQANTGPVSLAHKGLPLPPCLQDILPSNLHKNFSYLAFWPCSIPTSHAKTLSLRYLKLSQARVDKEIFLWYIITMTASACKRSVHYLPMLIKSQRVSAVPLQTLLPEPDGRGVRTVVKGVFIDRK